MTRIWLAGLVRRRPARLAGTALGIAVAVALLASLGAFLAQSKATMTSRAIGSVTVDWQVQVQPQADPAAVAALVTSDAHTRAAVTVSYGRAEALSASTGGTSQITSTATILGLPDDYRVLFPSEVRQLVGAPTGVMLAQQTAANLRVAPGDFIAIDRWGLAPANVRVDGIVDLPQANALFQTVGAPPGAQPQAPPDNVVLLPQNLWRNMFDPLVKIRPDLVSTQIHAARDHDLPGDPAAAYAAATAAARNFEARTAGAALVGDNLGAALGAARSDAAYAQVLFVFLGLPGAVLAAVLTSTIVNSGAHRRRADQALLRARGASPRQLLTLATGEAMLIGAAGAVLGLSVAAAVGYFAFGQARFGSTPTATIGWAVTSAVVGIVLAALTVIVPARRDLRERSIAAVRVDSAIERRPLWARYGLDVVVLVLAALTFAITSRNGYQLVVAPEGTPTVAVSYWAFAAPALLWIGAALLVWRATDLLLGPGRPLVRWMVRPYAGALGGVIANSLSRQRRPLVRAVVVLAMAIGFAVSTATFNATYRQQSEVDALLTAGADVAVHFGPSQAADPQMASRLAEVPGVKRVEGIQHRFAYVGAELQDFYGVDPATVTGVTALQDTYFQGNTAAGYMATLAAQPDAILVSAETVQSYQLQPGDTITLRLTDVHSGQQRPVRFRYVGIVNEFPTAPKDSFFVANARYVADQTGSGAIGTYLVDTGGVDTAAVAARIAQLVGTSAKVTDIESTRGQVGSSLTAVDLNGLTRIELSYAVLLSLAAGGLALALRLAERRRSFAIFTALGARPRQIGAVVSSEAAILAVVGVVGGSATGAALSLVLVKVLSGVFDPPPSTIAIPGGYLAALLAIIVGGLTITAWMATLAARRSAAKALRDP